MGKKRRLKSAKAKFSAKHANHPRMQNLNREDILEVEAAAVVPDPEVVVQEEKVEIKPKTTKKPKRAEVIVQEEKVEIKPKPTPKPKTTKKPKRAPRKKTTKKDAHAST